MECAGDKCRVLIKHPGEDYVTIPQPEWYHHSVCGVITSLKPLTKIFVSRKLKIQF